MSGLTDVQRAYIWLAGSHPHRIVRQGRGYRGRPIKYGFLGEEELVLFGYSTPLLWLENRRLFRKLQAPGSYSLTDEGEAAFRKLLASGAGLDLNRLVREVTVAPRSGE